MGELLTDEERWQAVEEEASNANPWSPDFLIPGRPNLSDVVRGFARFIVAVIRYRILGGWEPLSVRQQVDSANLDRQLGPDRLAEIAAFMEEPFDFSGDFDSFDH
jgi:hypothetical protein